MPDERETPRRRRVVRMTAETLAAAAEARRTHYRRNGAPYPDPSQRRLPHAVGRSAPRAQHEKLGGAPLPDSTASRFRAPHR